MGVCSGGGLVTRSYHTPPLNEIQARCTHLFILVEDTGSEGTECSSEASLTATNWPPGRAADSHLFSKLPCDGTATIIYIMPYIRRPLRWKARGSSWRPGLQARIVGTIPLPSPEKRGASGDEPDPPLPPIFIARPSLAPISPPHVQCARAHAARAASAHRGRPSPSISVFSLLIPRVCLAGFGCEPRRSDKGFVHVKLEAALEAESRWGGCVPPPRSVFGMSARLIH